MQELHAKLMYGNADECPADICQLTMCKHGEVWEDGVAVRMHTKR